MSRVRIERGLVEIEGDGHPDQLADTARLLWDETQGGATAGPASAGQQLGFGFTRVERGEGLGRGHVIQPRAEES